jgi:hypothetical protein
MNACLVRVRRGDGRRSSFLMPASFTIGNKPGADLWIDHRSLDDGDIQVSAARMVAGADSGSRVCPGPDRRSIMLDREVSIDIRPFAVPALFLVLLAVPLLFFLVGPGSFGISSGAPPEQDWTPVSLPSLTPLGYCAADRTHPRGVRFGLPSAGGERTKLVFSLGGVKKGEIEVLLDGLPLSASIPLPSGWSGEFALPLPAGRGPAATQGSIIEFRYHGGQERSVPHPWCVRGVRILPGGPSWAEPAPAGAGPSISSSLTESGRDLAGAYAALPLREEGERIRIERMMKDRLASELVHLRSLQASGRSLEARQFRQEILGWIPVNWAEGWRMIDGLGRR